MGRRDQATVALTRGRSRTESVAGALEAIAKEVRLEGVRRVLVKPNFVRVDRPLAATHVDAVRAVLDFLRARWDGPIVVAEGAGVSPTREGFRRYGYEALVAEYDVELVDLNADASIPVRVFDRRLRPFPVELSRRVAEADFRVSVCPPKTHDAVGVTLAVKNIVMGSLVNRTLAGEHGDRLRLATLERLAPRRIRESRLAEWSKAALVGRLTGSSKMAMHQGYAALNVNLARVAARAWPHLAVIDGWEGMEGSGPADGDLVPWRLALAGTDALAVDTLAAFLMGFDPAEIGYLRHCRRLGLGVGEVPRIAVAGNLAVEDARRPFTRHPTHHRQAGWWLPHTDRYLIAPG